MTEKSWEEIPIGGVVLEAGNSFDYETGGWRSRRPILNRGKCNNCMICWVSCPDGTCLVRALEGGGCEMTGFDLKHCKGCGVCAEVCPREAITMVDESKAREEAAV